MGIRSMKKIWEKFTVVYGNEEYYFLVVKSKLENFATASTQEHEAVIELYEEVQYAVTQLSNVNSMSYIQEDFILINKLVMKLSAANQRHYAEYVTSPSLLSNSKRRWDTFWTWISLKYEKGKK